MVQIKHQAQRRTGMYNVYCDLSNKRRLGRVIKTNTNTVWVRIMIGAKHNITIKRHIIKHNVRCYDDRIQGT